MCIFRAFVVALFFSTVFDVVMFRFCAVIPKCPPKVSVPVQIASTVKTAWKLWPWAWPRFRAFVIAFFFSTVFDVMIFCFCAVIPKCPPKVSVPVQIASTVKTARKLALELSFRLFLKFH